MTRRNVATNMQRGERTGLIALGAIGCLVSFFLSAAPRTAEADGITVTVAGGTGARGGTAQMTIALSGDEGQAVGAGLFLDFSSTLLSLTPSTDCAMDSRLASTHTPAILPVQPCGAGLTCLDFEVGTTPPNLNLVGNGNLFTCTFHIAADAPLEPIPLNIEPDSVVVGGCTSQPCTHIVQLPATGVGGAITVIEAATPTPTATPKPCTISADCPEGSVCLPPSQVCGPQECNDQSDCPADSVCKKVDDTGTCTALPGCTKDADCPQGICVTPPGACTIVTCSTENPCPTPPDRVCVDGICAPAPTPAVTATATPTPTPTPSKTATPTNTPPNTATPTRTNTVPPTSTATRTSAAPSGGGADHDGCSISQPGSGGSLLWLLVPAAIVVWRRRR